MARTKKQKTDDTKNDDTKYDDNDTKNDDTNDTKNDDTKNDDTKDTKNDDIAAPIGKRMLVFDAREPGLKKYLVTITEATPEDMRQQLLLKNEFNDIYFGDGPDGLDELVGDDAEEDDVIEWFDSVLTPENEMAFPCVVPIEYFVSIMEEM